MLGSGAITASARDAVLRRAPISPERARNLRPRIRNTSTAAPNPLPRGAVFGFRSRPVGKHRKVKLGDWQQPWLRVAGALLLFVSSCIHLALYLTGYRAIPTIGWLFLVQFMVAFVLAVGALVTHSRLVAVAGAAFALSTLGCYLLAVWIGLFGFKEIRTRAGIAAGLIEVAAFATLALAAVIRDEDEAEESASPKPRMLAGMRAAVSLVVGAVGAVSVAALVLFGIAVAGAAGEPTAAARGGVTLKTATIGGVTVLTNAKGLTLYWFAPDTPTTSKCTGSCAAYWPPVTGTPTAGPSDGQARHHQTQRWQPAGDLQRPSAVHVRRRQRPGPGARQQPQPQRRPVV